MKSWLFWSACWNNIWGIHSTLDPQKHKIFTILWKNNTGMEEFVQVDQMLTQLLNLRTVQSISNSLPKNTHSRSGY